MAGNGPVPKDPEKRARRNATVAMTKLPAEGRKGPAPAWPLLDDIATKAKLEMAKGRVKQLLTEISECSDGRTRGKLNRELGALQETVATLTIQLREQRKVELAVWRELWATPQAVEWEHMGWIRDVATYVRHKVRGELGSIDDAKEARMWSDRLGLNPQAMLRLRWTVVVDEVTARREEQKRPVSRQRYADLRVIEGGGSDAVAGA